MIRRGRFWPPCRPTVYTFAASETAAADSGHGHRRMLEMRVRASVSYYKRHRETLRTLLRGQTAHEHLTVYTCTETDSTFSSKSIILYCVCPTAVTEIPS